MLGLSSLTSLQPAFCAIFPACFRCRSCLLSDAGSCPLGRLPLLLGLLGQRGSIQYSKSSPPLSRFRLPTAISCPHHVSIHASECESDSRRKPRKVCISFPSPCLALTLYFRANVDASQRSDRGLQAHVEPGQRSSDIRGGRTGLSLYLTEQAVIDDEMYEEEDGDLPIQIPATYGSLTHVGCRLQPKTRLVPGCPSRYAHHVWPGNLRYLASQRSGAQSRPTPEPKRNANATTAATATATRVPDSFNTLC